ncbi:MAG: NAD-dependent epimerase/dehydratase family protein [Taibaiella sp.]|nr:NAD-dependent epimerase/dehydratase family protein [Taibaiella sp.]
MKILISGATGFIGANLVTYLKDNLPGVEFSFLTRKKSSRPDEILWTELSQKSLDGIDAVVHLAGLAHDTKNTLDESAYYQVNFELTKLLYDYYQQSNAVKFIYISSVKAVADKVEGILKEDVSPSPATAYGKSKLKAEEYITQLSPGVAGKTYYILRPCMVHGPGNKGNLNLLYKFATKGLPYPLGAFDNSRSFLSIENFCFICMQLLTRDVQEGVYNLSDDEPLSTKELFSIISDVAGARARIMDVPKGLVTTLAKAGDLFNLPLNSERLQKLTENYVVSNARIKSALGIGALPVTARQGIARTISSFSQN